MTMLDSRGTASNNGSDQSSPQQPSGSQPQPASPSAGPDYGSASGGADYLDDDIPF